MKKNQLIRAIISRLGGCTQELLEQLNGFNIIQLELIWDSASKYELTLNQ